MSSPFFTLISLHPSISRILSSQNRPDSPFAGFQCSGERPVCSKCLASKALCVYEANSYETRYRQLKRTCERIVAENEDCKFLFDALVRATAIEAEGIMKRTRGAGVEDGSLRELVK